MAATFETVQVAGLSLHENGELAELTIQIPLIAPAEALADLLDGLARYYRVGAWLDRQAGVNFPEVWFPYPEGTGGEWRRADELFISRLVIGSPNEICLTGASRWVKDLYVIVAAFVMLMGAVDPSSSGDQSQGPTSNQQTVTQTVNVGVGSALPHGSDTQSITGLLELQNKNLEARMALAEKVNAGAITVSDYQRFSAELEEANRKISAGIAAFQAANK